MLNAMAIVELSFIRDIFQYIERKVTVPFAGPRGQEKQP